MPSCTCSCFHTALLFSAGLRRIAAASPSPAVVSPRSVGRWHRGWRSDIEVWCSVHLNLAVVDSFSMQCVRRCSRLPGILYVPQLWLCLLHVASAASLPMPVSSSKPKVHYPRYRGCAQWELQVCTCRMRKHAYGATGMGPSVLSLHSRSLVRLSQGEHWWPIPLLHRGTPAVCQQWLAAGPTSDIHPRLRHPDNLYNLGITVSWPSGYYSTDYPLASLPPLPPGLRNFATT